MGVDRSIGDRSAEALIFLVRDVHLIRVVVNLGEPEIDDVNEIAAFADTHKKVVWLDVAMNEVARVDELDTGDQLVGEKKYSLEAEFSVAIVEKVFERWPTRVRTVAQRE